MAAVAPAEANPPGYICFTAGKPCAMTTAGQRAVTSPGECGPPGG